MHQVRFTPPPEKAVIAGLLQSDSDQELFEIDLQEMVMLCETAGASVVDVIVQKRRSPESATYLGEGKLREIAGIMKDKECKTLVIDAELSPGQIRSVEKIVKGKVVDRSQVILDIFAEHARTNEAKIQVELAQMRTLYPRLTRAWTHFSQQVGGIGTRGPGEKQLEVDRRLVQKKINELRGRLSKIERSRAIQRKGRSNVFKAALVGYTNVGKSSLLNALSGSKEHVESKLFATLDTATRRTYVQGVGSLVISDTVGFIRKIPHHLVASFRSTLEVACEADLLLVVLDASCPWVEYQYATVNRVLEELEADSIPRLVVLNKSDRIEDPFERKRLEIAYQGGVLVSSFSDEDMERVKKLLAETMIQSRRRNHVSDTAHRSNHQVTEPNAYVRS